MAIVPIAAAGLLTLPKASADPDFYVLTLPMAARARGISFEDLCVRILESAHVG